jgi:uncharacterized protein YfaS (alpha-2-macroglobulin family)
MKKQLLGLLGFAAVAAVLLASCGTASRGSAEMDYPSTADPEIVDSHVSGPVSVASRIMVRFVDEVASADAVGLKAVAGIAVLSPKADGAWTWIDRRSLEFKPARMLPRGTRYTVEVFPQKIDAARFAEDSRFTFTFSIMNQDVSMDTAGFASDEGSVTDLVYLGSLQTADAAGDDVVERMLSATVDGKKVPVEWTHLPTIHSFRVTGIVKKAAAQRLKVAVDGASIGADFRRDIEEEVPAKTAFSVLSARVVDAPERCIEVSFSDPLLASQDFRGFVRTTPERTLRFSARGSVLQIFALVEWGDEAQVTIAAGIKNAAGEPLAEGGAFPVTFKAMRPEARFVGSGVIVPSKAGVTVPIETVNLDAVIVVIEKIYADRIGQFLQVNELNEANELHRVGKTIWKKIVPVPYTAARRNQWIRTGLDLSPLVEDDQHSLYRITITFDARHIEYPGAPVPETELLSFPLENLPLSEPSSAVRTLSAGFWDDYGVKAGSIEYSDDWYENRDNPLHPAFYQGYYYDDRSIGASRNFLVSDLGIIAQWDANNRLTVAVSDLVSAEPVGDAVVTVLDYQLQELAQARTDSQGLVSMGVERTGFLVIAESRSTKGYLRLQGTSNLPVSSFDVAGQQVQRGVKGFIYGERGVWRPGDTIHLTFILQDGNNALPDDHPVVLRLFDPRGRLVKTESKKDPVGSFYHFAVATGTDSPTGTYNATISVGGVSFSKALPVETVKPNRLKITIDFGVKELTTDPTPGKLDVAWLHGAPAGDMNADVNVQLSPVPTSFAGYKGYVFDDPVRSFRAEAREVFNGKLDANGKAGFTMGLSAGAVAPGKLQASFRTRVFEPGGNINTDTFTLPFHPYAEYAGVRIPDAEKGWLDVDQPHKVQVALVSDTGTPVAAGEVEIDVYEIGWRWWWDREDDDIADYLGTRDYSLVSSERVKVTNGAAEWTLKFKERVWGRYLVRVRDTRSLHATGQVVYLRWPGWYYTSPEQGGDSANVLVFQSDKTSYAVGETAKVTIPTAERGRALVSIENNGKLLSTEWIETRTGETLYAFKLTPAMTPNVYVHVSLVQPHGQTVNDRPIRMFGVIPLLVEDPATRLTPVFVTPDVYEPESTVNVTVSESSGRAMTYTLAIVDEGLLSLTRYTTPDPWSQFYKRDALAVSTFDTYGLVAAAFGGTLEKLLAIGGGDEGLPGEGRKADRFPPMVRFLGPFQLAQGKSATHKVDIPQYVGAVRVMVVAGSAAAYGTAEKTVTVKKPVMVYATLPRVVSVTEKFALPASIFALEEGIASVDVSVKTTGKISIAGESRKTVRFSKVGDQLVTFDCVAATSPGLATVELTATSGKVTSTQKIEIDVRVPNPAVTTVDEIVLKKGEAKEQVVNLAGLPGTNEVVLEISKIAPINLEKHLRYLIHYPYGCVEQTTSSGFPQLYLDVITDLSEKEAAEVRKNVQATVDRLQRFQTPSGGLGFWPGDTVPSVYATTFATHFLVEAERRGYVVAASLKRGVLSYLRTQALLWSWGIERGDLVQAYALYDLALAGEPELGAMNRMREKQDLPVEARFKLAGAYALAGQRQEAQRLVRGAIPAFSPYRELGGTYGSALRDMAMLAEGYLEAGEIDAAVPLINEISKSLAANLWYSTQTTAYSLLVIGKYLATWDSGAPLKVSYDWNGKRETAQSDAAVKRIPLALRDETTVQKVRVANESDQPLYVRILKTGQPAPGAEKPMSNGLGLAVRYYDEKGAALNVDALPQGTDIVAEITVSNPSSRWYEELAMTFIAPAGWEIANPRFEGWTQDRETGFEYQDIRDDRVFTFFSLRGSKSKTLKLMLNASYLGRFYLPPAKVEAMYDSSINAAGEGKWITVDAP